MVLTEDVDVGDLVFQKDDGPKDKLTENKELRASDDL